MKPSKMRRPLPGYAQVDRPLGFSSQIKYPSPSYAETKIHFADLPTSSSCANKSWTAETKEVDVSGLRPTAPTKLEGFSLREWRSRHFRVCVRRRSPSDAEGVGFGAIESRIRRGG